MTNPMTVSDNEYRDKIFDHIPLYQTRIVKTMNAPFEVREQVKSPDDVFGFLSEYFEARDREYMVAVFLDTANTVIGMSVLSIGDLSGAYASTRDAFKHALLANAAAIVLAHNHPSGNPEPSRADISVTREMVEAGEVMGIPIHDHLIFAEGAYTSLATEGYI